jgi:two-component system, NarL family, sensor kinase
MQPMSMERTRTATLLPRRARQAAPPLLADPGGESEALLRSTLDSLSHVAVLDKSGTIVAVNHAWRAFADQSGYRGRDHGVGTNYLAVCERAAGQSEEAASTAKALGEVMAGRRREFRLEYPCTSAEGPRWFQLRITRPQGREVERIVVAHEDITEVKLAQEELTELTARLMQVQDEERRALARELHDTTAQNLLAVTLSLTRMRERLRNGAAPPDRALAEILELTEQSLQDVRTLSYILHPPLLDLVGLGSALRWLSEGFSVRSGVAVETAVAEGLDGLPREAATALFRVAQECLANVHRHSGSGWARLSLAAGDAVVRLEVVDGGNGFAAATGDGAAKVGVGLSGMRVRLHQLGGRLEVDSGPAGTRVAAIVPWAARDGAGAQ